MRQRVLVPGLLALTALVVVVSPLRAQDEDAVAHSIKIRGDVGDRIFAQMQGVESTTIHIGDQTVAAARTESVLDQLVTVESVDSTGRIREVLVQTPRHGAARMTETAQGRSKPDVRAGALHASEVRFTHTAGTYAGLPVGGVTTPALEEQARQRRTDVLWGHFLPNGALAVGATETGESNILLNQFADDLDGRARPKAPLKLTLERVDMASMPRRATVTCATQVELEVALDAESKVLVPLDCTATVDVDLDSGHIVSIKMRADGSGTETLHGKQVKVDAHIEQNWEFKRVAHSWTYKPQPGSAPPRETLEPVFDDRGWKVGFHRGAPGPQGQALTEWVPPGQSVKDWKELVSVQTFHGLDAQATPEVFMNNTRENLLKAEPKAEWSTLRVDPQAVEYMWALSGSTSNPDQVEVARIIQGNGALHLIRYTAKTRDLAAGDREAWLLRIRKAEVAAGY